MCVWGGVHKVLIRQSTFFNLGVGVMEKSRILKNTPKVEGWRGVISLDFREGYLSLAEGPKYL